MITEETKNLITASFGRALMGMKISSIRGIGVSLTHDGILTVLCYMDRLPQEQDYEDLSDIVGEVIGN